MSSLKLNLTTYFRDSLADELILDVLDKSRKATPLETVDKRMFSQGQLPSDVARKCLNRDSPKGADEDIESALIIAAPVLLKLKSSHAQHMARSPERITPLVVPCVLNRDGSLTPPSGKKPWIPRNYLEPLGASNAFSIASLNEFDEYLSGHWDDARCANWPGYHSLCMDLLKTLLQIEDTTQSVSYGESEYLLDHSPKFYAAFGQVGAAMHVKNLYENLLGRSTPPKLYAKLLDGQAEDRPLLSLSEEAQIAAEHHLGQMSGAFALGDSQREAIHHFFATNEGEILAVNGPPGTGKTTLLQSAIASLWIKPILDADHKASVPPVIVASSSNNQAVTNVIRDFGNILDNEAENILLHRWLPGKTHSLGAYALSANKFITLKEQHHDEEFLCLTKTPALRGFFEDLENPEYINSAFKHFMNCYCEYSGREIDPGSHLAALTQVLEVLHVRIVETKEEMRTCLNLWRRCLDDHQSRSKVEADIRTVRQQAEATEARAQASHKELAAAQHKLDTLQTVHEQTLSELAAEPFLEGLFSFLGFVKNRKTARAKASQIRQGLPALESDKYSLADVEKQVQSLLSEAESSCRKAAANDTQAKKDLQTTRQLVRTLQKAMDDMTVRLEQLTAGMAAMGLEPEFTRRGLYRFLGHFDTHHRFELFLNAIHYYEASWLKELMEENRDNALTDEERWRRLTRLTPCIVSTLFMVPKFFQSYNKFFYEFIDLLILDEAGQAPPDKAAGVFALAKRALVVGDVFQIEPVYSIPPAIDLGNMREHCVYSGPEAQMPETFSASKGSAMKMAQAACPYHCVIENQKAAERGMYLLEHRRCHKRIINFCRDLVYPHLEVHTNMGVDDHYLYPQLGYAHIPSRGYKQSGSWQNNFEAKNIAQWLHDEKEKILSHYSKWSDDQPPDLADLVSIVTPFKAQERAIRGHLKRLLPENAKSIVVGTVHRLQGAERPIVLFSPVYGPGDVDTPFFDRGPNMLNVAVSRAKDAFLVFGNMSLFRKGDGKTPSRVLANHLFREDGSGELPGFALAQRDIKNSDKIDVDILGTLEQHREILDSTLTKSKKEAIIVSPFLSGNAIQADGVIEKIQGAVDRGVNVLIFSDAEFALKACGNNSKLLARIAGQLRNAGATLQFADGLHNKTIIVDNCILVEGSFNWLSASRDKKHANIERSILYRYRHRDFSPERIREETLIGIQHILSNEQYV